MNNLQYMENLCEKIGIFLSERQIEQFLRFYELLVDWNRVMNLTAITEYEEVVLKHFVDSLALGQVWDMGAVGSLIDVGTGAGFPGIPLKIVFPEMNVVLLDSLNKRVKFLEQAIEDLQLQGCTAVHGRAEDCARMDMYRGQFDLCVSRAVARLASLSEYCLPFVKVGGNFISYKSGDVEEETDQAKKAVHLLGGRIRDVKKLCLPDSDIHRAFVIIEKREPTAKKYPRRAGLPTKEPLL